MQVRKRLTSNLLAVALTLPTLGCTSDPTLPPTPAPPAGTLLLDGTTPGSAFGLLTFDPVSGALSPIATGVYANRSRLTPSGITAYSFAGQVSEDVYRLISSHKVGSEVPLLEFPGGMGQQIQLDWRLTGPAVGSCSSRARTPLLQGWQPCGSIGWEPPDGPTFSSTEGVWQALIGTLTAVES